MPFLMSHGVFFPPPMSLMMSATFRGLSWCLRPSRRPTRIGLHTSLWRWHLNIISYVRQESPVLRLSRTKMRHRMRQPVLRLGPVRCRRRRQPLFIYRGLSVMCGLGRPCVTSSASRISTLSHSQLRLLALCVRPTSTRNTKVYTSV